MAVGWVRAGQHARLRDLRLRALASDPGAFASSHAREAARGDGWWRDWAAASGAGAIQRTFVAGDDAAWTALALVRLEDDAEAGAVLNALWVAPEARGRGVGGELVATCAAWAAARGATELVAEVVASNAPALRVYRAAGFRERGRLDWSRRGRPLEGIRLVRPL